MQPTSRPQLHRIFVQQLCSYWMYTFQISIVVRKTVIEWLTSAHHDLKLCQDTLYLAVHVFDRVLDVMQVSRDCLELLAITCLLVASKQVAVVTLR